MTTDEQAESARRTHDASGHTAKHTMVRPIVEEVAPGVFSYVQPDGTWFINNMGFLAGDHHALVIDTTSTERRTRRFLDAVTERTGQQVGTLVNTHHHGDHTNGNCLVPAGATVIGHRACREVIVREGIATYPRVWTDVDWGDLRPRPPEVVVDAALDLWAGETHVQLRHPGYVAHTDGDLVAWLPQSRVLFTGDLVFHGGTPFILMGSLAGSLRALDWLRSFDAATFVPGHGPVFRDGAVLDRIADYLRLVGETAERARDRGLSPLQAASDADLSAFADLTDPERIVGNVARAMWELGDRSRPFDMAEAIAAMIAYNSGRPLTCVA